MMANRPFSNPKIEEILHQNNILQALRDINYLIVRENKPSRLLQKTCDILVNKEGFRSAWIILNDPDGQDTQIYQKSFKRRFSQFRERIRQGQTMHCLQRAATENKVVAIRKTLTECADCPLKGEYSDNAALSVQIRHKNRSFGYLTVAVDPVFIDSQTDHQLLQEIADSVAFALDVIERDKQKRKKQDAVAGKELQFRTLFDSMPDAVFIHRFTKKGFGNFIEVNRIACERYGYTREEFLKLTPADLALPDEAKKHGESHKKNRLAETGHVFFRIEHITKQRHRFPAEISSTLIDYGGRRAVLSVARDISNRRQAEILLKRAKETAESYLNIAAEIILSLDKTGRIILLNESGHRLLGYKKNELIGKNWFKACLPANSRENIAGVFRQLMQGKIENVAIYENQVITKDGTELMILWHNSLLKDDQGRIIGTLSSGENITVRKQAEAKLTESEANLRSLINARQESIWSVDRDFCFIIFNKQFAADYKRVYGISLKKGLNALDILPPELRLFWQKKYKQTLNGRRQVFEFSEIMPEGKHYFNVVLNPIRSGKKVIGVSAVSNDVTERKRIEQNLQESEERFRLAFYTNPDAITLSRLTDGKYIDVNKGFTENIGYTKEEALGKTAQELNIWADLGARSLLTKELKKKGLVANFETGFIRKDGKRITGLMSAAVMRLNGEAHIISITRNIEHIKQTERALRKSEERFRYLFENSPVALWEEDFSALYDYLQELKKSGIKTKTLRSYFKKHPEAIQECAKRVKVIDVNRAVLKLHQAENKEEFFGALDAIFTESSFAVFQEEVLALANGKTRFETEGQVKTLTGKTLDIYLHLSLRREGKQHLALVATMDISNLKQAEKEVRRSQARLAMLHQLDSAILEAQSVADISYAALGNLFSIIQAKRISIALFEEEKGAALIYSQSSLARETGQAYTVPVKDVFPDLPGLHAGRVLRTDDFEKLSSSSEVLLRLKESGIRSSLSIPIRAHGKLLGSLNLAFDQPRGYSEDDIGVGREVADSVAIALEQKRLHEALETHTRELEQSLEELRQIHKLSLLMGKTKSVNLLAEETIRVLRSAITPDVILFYLRRNENLELIAHQTGETKFSVSEAQHHHLGECLCGLAARSGKAVFSKNIHSDMRCTLTECKNAGLASFAGLPLLAGGRVIGVIGLGALQARDFSAQQSFLETLVNETSVGLQNALLLEALRRHEAELEERVTQRTMELERANKELESFSYSVSHDLRAPLRAIDGFSRILEEDFATELDDEARRLIGVVRDNTQRMGQLIDDLLDFSRVSRKSITLSEVDLANLANSIFHELTNAGQREKIRFRVQKLPPAQADASLLRQVFSNLLANALKFSAGKKRPVIEFGFLIDEPETVYYIKDNGVGFNMKYADKLFQIFQRLHSTEEFPGTGIGLSIVHRIITRHGGRVWAEAEEGKGATFYFTLPGGKGES